MLDAFEKSPEVLKVLIAHGADVHAKDNHGHTALYYAELSRHSIEIRLLKAAGAQEPPLSHLPTAPGSAGFGDSSPLFFGTK